MANRVNEILNKYNIKEIEEARNICLNAGVNVEETVKGVQPIAFDDAVLAYELGCAIAIKNGSKKAEETAEGRRKGLRRGLP